MDETTWRNTYITPLETFIKDGTISENMRFGLNGFVMEGISDVMSIDGDEMTDGDCIEAIALITDLWNECVDTHDFFAKVDNPTTA